eukprot:ctg_698.g354
MRTPPAPQPPPPATRVPQSDVTASHASLRPAFRLHQSVLVAAVHDFRLVCVAKHSSTWPSAAALLGDARRPAPTAPPSDERRRGRRGAQATAAAVHPPHQR